MQLFLASVLLVFVAVAIAPGEGVKCYDCIYPITSACENPVGDNVKTCTGDYCFNMYGKKDGELSIRRACSSDPDMADKDGCESASMFGTEATMCVCKSDLCNGASFQSVSVVSMVMLVLSAACVSRWL